jgi:hypothetical protein
MCFYYYYGDSEDGFVTFALISYGNFKKVKTSLILFT